ncbi:hypothetical protein [Halostella sp. PRR32]|uniref:hypothetical protein n=1 Tax=Halostella sp. PRR32 TaxID=3098147 RepID=UPI002B1E0479|nr:hypothetical protein [Halostella sp. PRR32]
MPPSPPFIDSATSELDTDRLMYEAIPLAKLIAAVGAIAIVPFGFAILFGRSFLAGLFVLVGQFVVAVGTGLVLLYVALRALQLANADDGQIGE